MIITGLPEKLKNVKMSYFIWCATGEGYTRNAKLVYSFYSTNVLKQAIDIAFGKDCPPTIIESVIEQTEVTTNQTYLDWNPVFKNCFYECFGATAWEQFRYVVCEQDGLLNLESKLHFNLS